MADGAAPEFVTLLATIFAHCPEADFGQVTMLRLWERSDLFLNDRGDAIADAVLVGDGPAGIDNSALAEGDRPSVLKSARILLREHVRVGAAILVSSVAVDILVVVQQAEQCCQHRHEETHRAQHTPVQSRRAPGPGAPPYEAKREDHEDGEHDPRQRCQSPVAKCEGQHDQREHCPWREEEHGHVHRANEPHAQVRKDLPEASTARQGAFCGARLIEALPLVRRAVATSQDACGLLGGCRGTVIGAKGVEEARRRICHRGRAMAMVAVRRRRRSRRRTEASGPQIW
mmetsp:Transcript_68633/g.146982  ORF Transcript_68633/g.146982 Transcript_68633/m.146982 type:complete len:287 (+) Transcript_68633:356-1216(+)